MKRELPQWTHGDDVIDSTRQMPEGAVGFVYKLTYDDGTMYIGKKSLHTVRYLPVLKKGKERIESLGRIMRNTGKGHRQVYDIVQKESGWKDYTGSHKEAKSKTPVKRQILEYAFSRLNLTYLEAKYLFKYDVLEDEKYLNDNILGKFYSTM